MEDTLVFTVSLESDCKAMGVLLPLSATTESIDLVDLTAYEITGHTTSKLSYIKKSFPTNVIANQLYVGEEITIRGTDIKAMITLDTTDRVDYTMYYGSDIQIFYKDADGITTYRFRPPRQTGYPSGTAFILQYWGIIDEPILDTNLFINRGVNNVFESVKRLKTVTNIQELQKTGFGFYTLYSKGII